MKIRVGDKCSVSIHGLLSRHYGVCVGHDRRGKPLFVHNTAKRGRVTRADFAEFSGGRKIRVDERAPPGSGERVARRALALVGQEYDLLRFNCEHMANLAVHGESYSRQVGAVAAVAVVGIVGVAAWGIFRAFRAA